MSNFFLGNLGAVALERYVKVMMEENDSNEAYNGIVFTNGLKHVDTAEELAVLAGENLIFEKLQKQTLNSMFSSSSKWKMLWIHSKVGDYTFSFCLKFRYSEKASKNFPTSTWDLTLPSYVKMKEDGPNFCGFLRISELY